MRVRKQLELHALRAAAKAEAAQAALEEAQLEAEDAARRAVQLLKQALRRWKQRKTTAALALCNQGGVLVLMIKPNDGAGRDARDQAGRSEYVTNPKCCGSCPACIDAKQKIDEANEDFDGAKAIAEAMVADANSKVAEKEEEVEKAGVALARSNSARTDNEEKIRAWADDIIKAVAPATCGSSWTCVVDSSPSGCQSAGCSNTVNISDHHDPETCDIHPTGGLQCAWRGHRVCWNCVMGDAVMRNLEIHENEWAFVRHEVHRIKYLEPEPDDWRFNGLTTSFEELKAGSPEDKSEHTLPGAVIDAGSHALATSRAAELPGDVHTSQVAPEEAALALNAIGRAEPRVQTASGAAAQGDRTCWFWFCCLLR